MVLRCWELVCTRVGKMSNSFQMQWATINHHSRLVWPITYSPSHSLLLLLLAIINVSMHHFQPGNKMALLFLLPKPCRHRQELLFYQGMWKLTKLELFTATRLEDQIPKPLFFTLTIILLQGNSTASVWLDYGRSTRPNQLTQSTRSPKYFALRRSFLEHKPNSKLSRAANRKHELMRSTNHFWNLIILNLRYMELCFWVVCEGLLKCACRCEQQLEVQNSLRFQFHLTLSLLSFDIG